MENYGSIKGELRQKNSFVSFLARAPIGEERKEQERKKEEEEEEDEGEGGENQTKVCLYLEIMGVLDS